MVVATSQNTESNQFGITMSGAPFQGSVEVTTRVHAFNRNFRWFNLSPTFISMYEIGDYIYLFFKEEALEAEMKVCVCVGGGCTCEIYSRAYGCVDMHVAMHMQMLTYRMHMRCGHAHAM